jgi:hypothetical protein
MMSDLLLVLLIVNMVFALLSWRSAVHNRRFAELQRQRFEAQRDRMAHIVDDLRDDAA